MNPKLDLLGQSLLDLEWPQLLDQIARCAVSDAGRELVLALRPCSTREEVELRQATLTELLTLAEADGWLPVRAQEDPGPALLRASKGGVCSAAELSQIAQTVRTALDLRRFGRAHREQAPQVARMLDLDPALGDVLTSLDRAISVDGQVLDQASDELSQARSKVRTQRRRIQSRTAELISKYREALQDGYFAERDGRYVLPVRADAPFRVEGFVFGTSQSGSTLYIEPKELAPLGHELRMAEVDVEKEEARVLARLTEELRPFADEIGWARELCARSDLLAAVTRFSRATAAEIRPLAQTSRLELRGVRHPLLVSAGESVVKNDLWVQAGEGLVISGPNAGGKTVALKAMGLLALMQSAGLPLPADAGTEVGFFPRVLADIGDDQSLSLSLSTFSGHVERVRGFLEEASEGTLILLDELMGGTDPSEGAVLAMATLEAMVGRGAAVVVTTHYDALKDFALDAEFLTSAAVGFDFQNFEPTFRVEMGRPGASSALFVARRHGLWEPVIARAESLLPEIDARMRQDRIEVEQLRANLERQSRELTDKTLEQESLNRRLEHQIQLTKEARMKQLVRETDELRSGIRDARAELRALRAKLKSASSEQDIKDAERSLDGISQVVSFGSEVDKTVRGVGEETAPGVELQPGMKVRLKKLRSFGEVLEAPRKGQVRVLMGSVKLSVPLVELELEPSSSAARKGASRPRSRAALASAAAPVATPIRSADVTLDLRGIRVESGLDELDQFIDRLLKGQEPCGFVLHGHGTGAMKEAVRQHLRGHRCIATSRPAEREEGGDALTVFWLVGA